MTEQTPKPAGARAITARAAAAGAVGWLTLAVGMAFGGGGPAAGAETAPAAGGNAPHATASARGGARSPAAQLVKKIVRAPGPEAREGAVRRLVHALNIGLVAADGTPLEVSPEPHMGRRFQLYDFQLATLAADFGRRDTYTLADVARNLTTAGLGLNPRKPFPVKLLREALVGAVRDAQKRPELGRSLLPLAVRELGRHKAKPYDLARKAPANLQLDAIQVWLITADIALPVLRQTAVPAGPSAAAGATRRTTGVVDACRRFNELSERLEQEIEKRTGGKIQAWLVKQAAGTTFDQIAERLKVKKKLKEYGLRKSPPWLTKKLQKTARAAKLAGAVIELLHGSLLAFSIEVVPGAQTVAPTHWYHGPPLTGGERTFSVKVRSADDYGELAANCGGLVGVDLPGKAETEGIGGLVVGWEQTGTRLAPDHGTLDCQILSACATRTDANGVARVTFNPRSEDPPYGRSPELAATGALNGIVLYQSGFGSGLPGEIGQFLFPKFDGTLWVVTYHPPPTALVFRSSFVIDHQTSGNGFSTDIQQLGTVSGSIELTQTEGGPNSNRRVYTGQGAVEYLHVSGFGEGTSPCLIEGSDPPRHGSITQRGDIVSGDTLPGTLRIRRLEVNERANGGLNVVLTYNPPEPKAGIHYYVKNATPGCATYPPFDDYTDPFSFAFLPNHFDEEASAGQLVARNWKTVAGGDVVARKTYAFNGPGNSEERTTLELFEPKQRSR